MTPNNINLLLFFQKTFSLFIICFNLIKNLFVAAASHAAFNASVSEQFHQFISAQGAETTKSICSCSVSRRLLSKSSVAAASHAAYHQLYLAEQGSATTIFYLFHKTAQN